MGDRYYKAINFDLDTKKLKEFYSKKGLFAYNKAYKDIRTFFEKNGFSHRQGSGYVSEEKLTRYDALGIVSKLSQTFPWLKDCIKKFDITDIGQEWDLTMLIKGERVIDTPQINTSKSLSLDERLAQAQEKANQLNKTISEPTPQSRNKDTDIEIN